jgi:integrase
VSLIYKRPNSPYWYVVKTRQSTKTANKKLAEEFAKKALTAHWRENVLGTKVHTWAELATDWLDRKAGKASADGDAMVIRRFTELLERRKIDALSDVTADVVAAYGKQAKAIASAPTANRHLNTLRAMLRRAEAKEWIRRAPRIEAYEVNEAEAKWLTPEQAASIIPHLPEWVADMYVFAQQTGLRYSNVARFEWAWIRQDGNVAFVPAVDTKTKRTYSVPLSDVAKGIVAKLRLAARNPVYMFVGEKFKDHIPYAPVKDVDYWWKAAVAKAGLDVNWHEATRHTWATMHTKRRTPDRILAKMGGWASTKMLARYGHHDADDLIEYANNLNDK